MFTHDPPGRGRMDPRDTVGRISKEDHYTLLHTKFKSFGSAGLVVSEKKTF